MYKPSAKVRTNRRERGDTLDKLLVAEFRVQFRDLTEPTEVVRYGRTVGTYYPAGTIPVYIEEEPETDPRIVELAAEIERLKATIAEARPPIGLPKSNVYPPLRAVRAEARPGANNAPFTPVPHPGRKK